MPHYIRAFVPGGTFFFTVTLLDRRRKLLNDYITDLRAVIMAARQRRPFIIDAIAILPDHLHCLWTLPLPLMLIFRGAGMILRLALRRGYLLVKACQPAVCKKGSGAFGSGGSGNT